MSQSYWPELLHGCEIEGLARTNNELESHFRALQHHLLPTTGQKGGTRRALNRLGVTAQELVFRVPRPGSPAQLSTQELAEERQRADQHRQRLRFEVISLIRADARLDGLNQQWMYIPKDSTGNTSDSFE